MILLPFLAGVLLFGSPMLGICLAIMYLTEP
jgi:hypothetical protein